MTPRHRLIGGNVKDVVKQLNKNVAAVKTMAQSLKSDEVKSLISKATDDSLLLETISTLPLNNIKHAIYERLRGAAPDKSTSKETRAFDIYELVPKSLLDNVRRVGEKARGILGGSFAAAPTTKGK